MKCLYLVVRSLDPKGTGRERWMNRWKPALNAFAITFDGRLFLGPSRMTTNNNRQTGYTDFPRDPNTVGAQRSSDQRSISPISSDCVLSPKASRTKMH